ncbi:hypothetical protein EHQ58_11940 [Leptospira ognonensis]|uniref:Fatty acid desaturase domain-containing protein n=2 Tax=Leptospira ognonensis TaxID=2484945 RepID=A0A4R9JZD1_9LEPT|nr:hypothetical protein EHQ58_11940 [Leptospira ognonensis]
MARSRGFFMSPTLEMVRSQRDAGASDRFRPSSLDGPRKAIRSYLFKPNGWKAMKVLAFGFLFQTFSYSVIYAALVYGNYFLLVTGWILCGMSVTSLFVIGHDCAHGSFLKNTKVGDFIGHVCFLFSFYPYYGWKYTHNAHHAHTNDISTHSHDVYFDNAWTPFTVEEYLALKQTSKLRAFLYKMTRYFPPFGSLLHNVAFHAFPGKFIESHKNKLYFSYGILVLGLGFICYGLSMLVGNPFAFFHFLIMPGILFQFWMSYYTYLHHTSTEIQFYQKSEWTPYLGQIVSTYNFLNPKWLSFIHFHIDIHTPHHLSTAIPCYHLLEAYKDLKCSDFAEDLKEGKFQWSYLFKQLKECHVWDMEEKRYRRFSEVEGV